MNNVKYSGDFLTVKFIFISIEICAKKMSKLLQTIFLKPNEDINSFFL